MKCIDQCHPELTQEGKIVGVFQLWVYYDFEFFVVLSYATPYYFEQDYNKTCMSIPFLKNKDIVCLTF